MYSGQMYTWTTNAAVLFVRLELLFLYFSLAHYRFATQLRSPVGQYIARCDTSDSPLKIEIRGIEMQARLIEPLVVSVILIASGRALGD